MADPGEEPRGAQAPFLFLDQADEAWMAEKLFKNFFFFKIFLGKIAEKYMENLKQASGEI